MKKRYKISVDCANCANKIEDAINKLEEVNSATINFMSEKLVLEADKIDDSLLSLCEKEGRKVDSDFEIFK